MNQDETWLGVGLGPGHIVLDGDPAPPQKGHSPYFSALVYCVQTVAHLSYCWALVRYVVLQFLKFVSEFSCTGAPSYKDKVD